MSARWARRARPAGVGRNVAKTAAQVVLFWGLLLFVAPPLIHRLDLALGVPPLLPALPRSVAAAIFLACSALGLASAWSMAAYGEGTPLPMDAPRRLVIRGPYARLRNPMAVAGLGQGIGVALWLHASLVLAYVASGGLLWQLAVRGREEADLSETFGEPYDRYRRAVRCWIPRMTPYENER